MSITEKLTAIDTFVEKDQTMIVKQAELTLAQAKKMEIKTDADYPNAVDFLKTIKKATKNLDEIRKRYTKPLDDKKKIIMDFFKTPQANIDEAIKTVDGKIYQYDKVKREEEQRRYEEALRAQRAEEERLRKEAESQKTQGNLEIASMIEEKIVESEMTDPVIPINEHQKDVSGRHYRDKYTGEVFSKSMFLRWVLEHPEYDSLWDINQGKLNQLIQNTKGSIQISGVKITKEQISFTRTA